MFQANPVGFESSLWAPIDNVSELHSTVVAWMRVKAANTIWNGFSANGFWIPFLAESWIPKAGFWIPKPSIPDSSSKNFLECGIRITLHVAT